MKRVFTVLTAALFIMLLTLPVYSQTVGDGYSKILELNKFGDDQERYPAVADEVHAGYDLDKDGNLEFIFLADHSNPNGPSDGWGDGHSIWVYEWNGSAFELMWMWGDTSLVTGGASFPTMAVADLDGDTDQEIILGMPSGAGSPAADVSPTVIYSFEFGSAGYPTEPTAEWTADTGPGANARPAGMAAGDIDGDGADEVAVAFRAFSDAATNDALMIFSLNGGYAGAFTQWKKEVVDTTGDWGSVYAVDITDLDNDGNKEAYFSTDYHTTYEADGPDSYILDQFNGGLSNPTVPPWTIQGVSEVDIDNDGNNELAFGHWSTGIFGLFHSISDLAETDSTNEAAVAVVEPGGCRGLTAGDFDGDGNGDIFLGGNYAGSLWRIEYKGSGSITDSASYTYELVYQDSAGGENRVYGVSFPGDNFSVKQGGITSNDMNGNGEPEVLIAYEDGPDSLYNWIVMVEGNGVTALSREPGAQFLKSYTLSQNYPNPFNPTTSIKYTIPAKEQVSLKVYDMLGRSVKTLVNTEMAAGEHTAVWDGTNNSGASVVSGTYIYTLKVGDMRLNKRMTLLK